MARIIRVNAGRKHPMTRKRIREQSATTLPCFLNRPFLSASQRRNLNTIAIRSWRENNVTSSGELAVSKIVAIRPSSLSLISNGLIVEDTKRITKAFARVRNVNGTNDFQRNQIPMRATQQANVTITGRVESGSRKDDAMPM